MNFRTYGAALLLAILQIFAAPAHAAGPRWVGSNGSPMTWNRNDLTYWVDSGPLSTYVSNSAAQTLVAAAASVWNIEYSYLTLSQGGTLDEDVSSWNVYLGTGGPIWPTDVASGNYANKPIAVLFDADGTITDMLLGSGASAPYNCRQNAVTESVDLFLSSRMAHAILVLNGRCTGPASEQQLQMQYQLERAFGRVLGLGWSQVNDNVFTGAPQPTYQQQMHWPIMHPIDIVCGSYTYQCLPEPFTLRDDDKSSLRLLYGWSIYNQTDGEALVGILSFPTGQGMGGVNMVAVRQSTLGIYGVEGWETTSSVTGYAYKGANGNPVTGSLTGFDATLGTKTSNYAGYWFMASVPAVQNVSWNNVYVTPQAINPLYVGQYAVGPYRTGQVSPSGTLSTTLFSVVGRYGAVQKNGTLSKAAADCGTGNDGTESAPALIAASGIWSGRLCAYGHTSWGSATVAAGRTGTLEAMALDENGNASSTKARLLLGIWHGGDATGKLPTVGSAAAPFNSRQNGTTQLKVSFSAAETIRFAITDERGEGRPDFTYTARFLYADSVLPARMDPAGGTVRILGSGFQPGNVVTIGGVTATVTSLTANEIDAMAPSLATLGNSSVNDVVIADLRTGGTASIPGGLVYGSTASDSLVLVQAPSGSIDVGVPSAFSMRLVNSSGGPVQNGTVSVSVLSGSATFSQCGLASCVLVTDASGLAQTSVTASAAGLVVLRASISGGTSLDARFTAVAPSRSVTALRSPQFLAAGAGVAFQPAVVLVASGSRAAGIPVSWGVSPPVSSTVATGDIHLTGAASGSASDGIARISALANLAGGESAQLTACAWTSVCATLSVVGVSQDDLAIVPVQGTAQVVASGTPLSPVVLRVTDTHGNSVAGATVEIYQAVDAWQPACISGGRCPVAPVYGTSSLSLVSDDDGQLTVTPLQYDGTAAMTKIVAATGSSGYLSFTLVKQP